MDHILTFFEIIIIFFLFLSRCKQNRIKPCHNWLQFVKKQTNKKQKKEPKKTEIRTELYKTQRTGKLRTTMYNTLGTDT